MADTAPSAGEKRRASAAAAVEETAAKRAKCGGGTEDKACGVKGAPPTPSMDPAEAKEKKRALRRAVQAKLKAMSPEAVERESAAVTERCLPYLEDARGVSIYLSMPGEIVTSALLAALFARKKRVFVPHVYGPKYNNMRMIEVNSAEEHLSWPMNKWGIPELPNEDAMKRIDALDEGLIDVVITPGVAFDSTCNRLGHGKGYYDSFLARSAEVNRTLGRPPPRAVGLALSPQMLPEGERVVTNEYDRQLWAVVGPDTVFTASVDGTQPAASKDA